MNISRLDLQDADSLDAAAGCKKEGAFYVWEAEEIDAVLASDSNEAQLLREVYSVCPEGNATFSQRRSALVRYGVYSSQECLLPARMCLIAKSRLLMPFSRNC